MGANDRRLVDGAGGSPHVCVRIGCGWLRLGGEDPRRRLATDQPSIPRELANVTVGGGRAEASRARWRAMMAANDAAKKWARRLTYGFDFRPAAICDNLEC